MPDFSSLLDSTSGSVKKPRALPQGDYLSVIRKWEPLEAPKDKEYTMIIRLGLTPVAWPEDVPEDERQQQPGTDGAGAPIDLSKRSLRRDYYNHRLFDLDELLAALEIDAAGRLYRELLPELIGRQVVAEVQQYINARTNEVGNQVGNLRAPA